MNILERVQNLFSTVFCLHGKEICDRQAQISRHFEEKSHIDDARENAVESAMVEKDAGDKDNFLRGSLMNEQRRRHSKTINKIAASYWAHGMGCSCCKDSCRPKDFERVAPTKLFNEGTTSELSKAGYIDLAPNDPETELQCLTSFITESGRHRVITSEFADQVTQASLANKQLQPLEVTEASVQEVTQPIPRRQSVPTLQSLPAMQPNNVVEIQARTRLAKLIQK